MDPSAISPATTGLLIAAFLSSLGYVYKIRREAKQSAKRVLYLLLEIRYSVSMSILDPQEMKSKCTQILVEVLEEKGVPASTSDIDEAVVNMLVKHFTDLSDAATTDIQERLIDPFEQALSELSLSSPIMAYRLRGKEKTDRLIQITTNRADLTAQNDLATIEDEHLRSIFTQSLEGMKTEAINFVYNDLDRSIRRLAIGCGIFDYLKTLFLLRKRIGFQNSDGYNYIKTSLTETVNQLIQAAQNAENESSNVTQLNSSNER